MVLGDLRISGDGRRGDEGTDGAGYDGHAREAGVDGTSTPASPVPKRSKKHNTDKKVCMGKTAPFQQTERTRKPYTSL